MIGLTNDSCLRLVPDSTDSQSAIVLVSETDIHAVAGLLKMYLRDLPEPLFTDELYPKFVEANGKRRPRLFSSLEHTLDTCAL